MVEKFGQNPATVPILLEFLTVFPEEISTNSRIPLTVSAYSQHPEALLIDILLGRRICGRHQEAVNEQCVADNRTAVHVHDCFWYVTLFSVAYTKV